MHLVFVVCELSADIHRVSQKKRGPFFQIGIIQLFLRNLSKLLYGHKMILLCSEEESKYSSTSARSAVIITSDCNYDNIVSS